MADAVKIPLVLAPYEAKVIVVGPLPKEVGASEPSFGSGTTLAELNGDWSLTLNGKPMTTELKSREELGTTGFAGPATYHKQFTAEAAPKGKRVYLEIAEVHDYAKVTLNGKELGAAGWQPYRWDVTGALKNGANDLVIEVDALAQGRGGAWRSASSRCCSSDTRAGFGNGSARSCCRRRSAQTRRRCGRSCAACCCRRRRGPCRPCAYDLRLARQREAGGVLMPSGTRLLSLLSADSGPFLLCAALVPALCEHAVEHGEGFSFVAVGGGVTQAQHILHAAFIGVGREDLHGLGDEGVQRHGAGIFGCSPISSVFNPGGMISITLTRGVLRGW